MGVDGLFFFGGFLVFVFLCAGSVDGFVNYILLGGMGMGRGVEDLGGGYGCRGRV